MPYVAVTVYCLDDASPTANAVAGAVLRFFDSSNRMLHTQGTSDANGLVSVLLPTEMGPFVVRSYKFGCTQAPVLMDVTEDGPNIFEVTLGTVTDTTPTDPYLCCASGYFRGADGSPLTGLEMYFMPQFDPLVVSGAAVLAERVHVRSDETGYASVTLFRNGIYEATIEGMEDSLRTVMVPDLPTASLPEVLFPVVSDILFDPAPVSYEYDLSIGEVRVLTPTIFCNSGLMLEGTALEDVVWSVVDSNIASISVSNTTVTVRGVASGSTTMTVTRSDTSIIYKPDVPISGVPITFNVS